MAKGLGPRRRGNGHQAIHAVRVARGIREGSHAAHGSPPPRRAGRETPRCSTTVRPACATSSKASTGKSRRYGWPVAGFAEAGPVEPKQLPSEFHADDEDSATYQWACLRPPCLPTSPKMGLPGTRRRAPTATGRVNSSTALSAFAESSPQVSKATVGASSAPCSIEKRAVDRDRAPCAGLSIRHERAGVRADSRGNRGALRPDRACTWRSPYRGGAPFSPAQRCK